MPVTDTDGGIRVALLGPDLEQRRRLRLELAERGLDITTEARLSAFSRALARGVDVLLVCLEGADDAELDALDRVAEERTEPMVFFESAVLDADTVARVAEKLNAAVAVGRRSWVPARAVPAPALARGHAGDAGFPLWVLGASFGGPEALKRFLAAMPEVPDAAFLVAQHIGDGFAEVLADQLHRGTPFPVVCAVPGMALQPGRVYVAPIRERLVIDERYRFVFGEAYGPDASCTPCIDDVLATAVQRFGPAVGAVIFSGMGDDGARGVRAVQAAGGVAWAQDDASCAIASMPREAMATGAVSRRGPPEALAEALVQHIREAGAVAEESA